MHYSNSNYESFMTPRKPAGVDDKSAYLVGGGLASLAAAVYLIRDGRMDGSRITILEASDVLGGALDASGNAQSGWLTRGGREMEEQFQCLWDLYRSIPSLEIEGASVLDEFWYLNHDDPNSTQMRATINRGEPLPAQLELTLTAKARRDILKMVLTTEDELNDKTIAECMSDDFFASHFWLYWRTMFAFETWHSAIEMKRYLQRFIHQISGLADFTTIKFTRYTQQQSLVLPIRKWLEDRGVTIQFNTRVTNVIIDKRDDRKTATRIEWLLNGEPGGIDIDENVLVTVTNGSMVENSAWGDHHTAPVLNTEIKEGSIWQLWRNLAAQDDQFGNPEKFCGNVAQSVWESATITTSDERVINRIHEVIGRDPLSGHAVTGGPTTFADSGWLMGYSVSRQPYFKDQLPGQLTVWTYGLFMDTEGDYVKKKMGDCTGEEIAQEWLYHLGFPLDEIDAIAADGLICNPCMLPFITSQFMPRTGTDRPKVLPEGSVNLAFVGQFAETERDCVFTTEYSVRTAMEAVYTWLGVERGVPEVFGSIFDVRQLLKATSYLQDGEQLHLPKLFEKWLEGDEVGVLLEQYKLI